jgi:hypothetical protein
MRSAAAGKWPSYRLQNPDYFQEILTQSSRSRGEWGAVTKFNVFYMLFIIFKINMKEESCFLITNIPLRSLRLCVMIFSKKSLTVGLRYAEIRG